MEGVVPGSIRNSPLPRALLGREKELESLTTSFDEGARLVTLVGPGGIGKTTLAAEHSVRRVATGARSRAVVVDLHGASTVSELLDRVVGACGGTASDAAAAIDALEDVVLVLDDYDGLVPVALATVGAWIDRCAEVEVLVTSRERLGIAGESVYEVGPLDPGAAGAALLASAAARAAIGFRPRAEDGAVLGEIAALLEGVPLAIELAAARLPLVGPAALLAELRAGVALRRRGQGAPERHASLEAAVRGSFDALAAHEQDVLSQLTVFRGGFTAETVRAVIESPLGDPVDILDTLRARSLVRTRDPGAARFDLYAQVRDHVTSARPGPIEGAVARHAVWFVAAAERVATHSHDEPLARAWLIAERENVLEIARRVLGAGAPSAARAEPALRAIVAAKEVLLTRGPSAELAELVSPIVECTRDSGADPKLSTRLLLLRGALRRDRGDVRASLKDLLAAESVARAMGDDLLVAEAALELAKSVRVAGELDAARHNFERAARLFSEAGARAREAEATALLGATAGEGGDLATARILCERAVAIAGHDRLLGARFHALLARAHAEVGDRASARQSAEEAAHRAELDGDPQAAGAALVLLGLVLHDEGDLYGASMMLARARDSLGARGLAADGAIARGHLGAIAREQGRAAEAYALLSEARDVALRTKRPAHAAYFGAHLAGLESELGRREAAAHILERSSACAAEREPDAWWPIASVKDVIAAQRAGAPNASTALYARLFARSFGARPRAAPPPSDNALIVGEGGAWFRPPSGSRVGLERRRSLALLLDHLARERIEHPGATVRSAALFTAAWPGEKAIASAAAHRVRVAIATLRKMGLRGALVTTPDGYGITSDTELVRA